MESVGGRLGRSSSRYSTTTAVFTGPVRKWKKKWVNVPPANSNHNQNSTAKGAAKGNNNDSSKLVLFKWTPIASRESNNDDGNGNGDVSDNADLNNEDSDAVEEPPRRKFKYIPVDVLEEQNEESSEQNEDDTNEIDIDNNTEEAISKSDGYDEKPDINDMPMEEDQEDPDDSPLERQDLNEDSTLDLNLGFKPRDGENRSDSNAEQDEDD